MFTMRHWKVVSTALLGLLASATSTHYIGCPRQCDDVGEHSGNWTVYPSFRQLGGCRIKPLMVEFSIYNDLEDRNTPSDIRACFTSYLGETIDPSLDNHDTGIENLTLNGTWTFNSTRSTSKTPEIASYNNIQTRLELETGWFSRPSVTNRGQIITAAKEVQALLLNSRNASKDSIEPIVLTVHYGDSVFGAYVGGNVNRTTSAKLIQELIRRYQSDEATPGTILTQLCGEGLNANLGLGFVADTTSNSALANVQKAIKSWHDAKCVTELDGSITITSPDIWLKPPMLLSNHTFSNWTLATTGISRISVAAAGDCSTIQVISGDGCGSLVDRCRGINPNVNPNDFTSWNPMENLCSTLKVGQHVCCSSGNMPDFKPKPKPDGSCATYVTQRGDFCAQISAKYDISIDEIEKWNENTWAWTDCARLAFDFNMCVSVGAPPMPTAIDSVECGPQKPGSRRPDSSTKLADLNPCPLNTCCNIWGHCGTGEDYCVPHQFKGRPGTSEPGKNGCISNCGMDVVNNDTPPSDFIKIGYFEAWNGDRECLHRDYSQIDKSFTHVHFAFGAITPSYNVSIGERISTQFSLFARSTNAKRILSFGGWADSTNPVTGQIFRDLVKRENRQKAADNIANFAINNRLDGIDFDWEYPGEPDIPGISPGGLNEGSDYLEFLKLLKAALGDRSLSIAAPASYWYLKAFPINDIARVVDYIVYMTYDLHGFWDAGNKWSVAGCEGGNCLRSHVNLTETYIALSMVTKAGVPSNKIVVGVSSYGRGFKMTDPSCITADCTWTKEGTTPGRCTKEPGYIANAEIQEILDNKSLNSQIIPDNQSMILVYGDQWVSFMTQENKESRGQLYRSLNFAGIVDWAIDLQLFLPDVAAGRGTGPGETIDPNEPQYAVIGDDWKHLDCRAAGSNDSSRDGKLRWHELYTDQAWSAALDDWTKFPYKGDAKLSFPRQVSNVFHGPDPFDCDVLSDTNSCHQSQLCLIGDNSGPAGTLIVNGFVTINSMLWNIYRSLESAANTLGNTLPDFSGTFAPTEKVQPFLSILLNILSFSLSMTSAKFFTNVLGQSSYFRNKDPARFADLKGATSLLIGATFTSGKDVIAAGAKPEEENLRNIAYLLQAGVNIQKFMMTRLNADIFSGQQVGVDLLTKLLGDGKMIGAPVNPAYVDEGRVLRSLYANLIPQAWRVHGNRPVLVDVKKPCGTVGDGNYDWVLPSTAEKSRVCLGKNLHYLLAPDGVWRDCDAGPHGSQHCTLGRLSSLPGVGTLRPGNWGNITLQTLADSAYAGYLIWGNRKEFTVPDLSNPEDFDRSYESIKSGDMATAPGVVNIPICDIDTVKRNWKDKPNTKDLDYPCIA